MTLQPSREEGLAMADQQQDGELRELLDGLETDASGYFAKALKPASEGEDDFETRSTFTAAPIWRWQRAPRWWLIGRSEDRTCCKVVVIWRSSALDLVARNIWTPRRNFAV